MNNYIKEYDAATQKILKQAQEIDRIALGQFDAEYSLYEITGVLRDLYKNHILRDKYVGDAQFQGFSPFSKGFCALTMICVYNLYGGADVWLPSAIKMGDWEHAPVVFLRELSTGLAFDPTGDQFAPLRVPYELGTPVNRRVRDMKTPNKDKFIKQIKTELDKRKYAK